MSETSTVRQPVSRAVVDSAVLRRTMSTFATGVAVVTTQHDAELHGMTVNSVTSVSLRPPLVLVCLLEEARTTRALIKRGAFVLNFLSKHQDEISNLFAKPGEQRFVELSAPQAMGLPYIPKALAHLYCVVDAIHPGGDHVIVVGRVERCDAREGAPLIFYRGKYHEVRGEGRPADWYW